MFLMDEVKNFKKLLSYSKYVSREQGKETSLSFHGSFGVASGLSNLKLLPPRPKEGASRHSQM